MSAAAKVGDLRAEAARALSVRESEIYGAHRDGAGRLVVTDRTSVHVVAPVDAPDGEGKTGVLFDELRTGRRAPFGAPVWVDPTPRAVAGPYVRHDALWSLDELDEAAQRVPVVPTPGAGASYAQWIGQDPVRARVVWRLLAGDVPLNAAADAFPACSQARDVVRASGWLAPAALDELD